MRTPLSTLGSMSCLAVLLFWGAGCSGDGNGEGDDGLSGAAEAAGRVGQEAVDLKESLGDWASKSADEAQTMFREQYDSLSDKVDALEERADEASEEMSAEAREALERLDTARDAAGKKLDELGDASSEAWKDVASGFAESFEELKKAYKEASSHFE